MARLRPSLISSLTLITACVLFHQACGFKGATPSSDSSSVAPTSSASFTCRAEGNPAVTSLRRLSKREYIATLKDLFGPSFDAPGLIPAELSLIPEENARNGFDTQNLQTTSLHVDGYFSAAEALAFQIGASNTRLTSVAGSCMTQTSPSENCISQFISTFGLKAYRRPLSSEEKSLYRSLFGSISATDGSRQAASVLILAFLQSPNFLYHLVDQGSFVQGRSDLLQLSPFEVAARLSYFAWGTMPDAELFQAAADGSLISQEGYKKQLDRLLSSARAKPVLQQFFRQWLEVQPMTSPTYPADYLSGVSNTAGLGTAMIRDFDDFIDHTIWDEKGDYKRLMTSNMAVIRSPELATVYGSTAQPNADQGTLVSLDPASRSGLLTRPAFLATSNHKTRPFHRGTLVLRKVLCLNIPSPDPNIIPGALAPPAEDSNQTTRSRFHAITASNTCQACHSRINPVGFAFESFDSLGRYRSSESIFDSSGNLINQLPIDSSGSAWIDGQSASIRDALDLSERVSMSHSGPACLVENFHEFVSGHERSADDECRMARMEEALLAPGGSILDMIRATAEAPDFRFVRIKQ